MTIHAFNQLSVDVQFAYTCLAGTYLAKRWADVHQDVHLYQVLGGFFVELSYDAEQNLVTHLLAFEGGGKDDRLLDYALSVRLPDWMPEVE